MLMNKQEFIERMKSLKNIFGNKCEYVKIDAVIELASELDEPQKPVVPQFVADLIEEARTYEWDLDDLFEHISEYSGDSEVSIWFYTLGNIDVLARAWLDGYEVEKEKRYLVKMKSMDKEFTMLKFDKIRNTWYLGNDTEYSYTKVKHTRKELKEAGFGWVFDCPGIEIEEVEE